MNILLIGAQASGKGTQAELLAPVLGVPHISSGDLFRQEIAKHTPLGLKIRAFIEQGELVPDEFTLALIVHRLQQSDCRPGVLLDGFPRTLAQAKVLDGTLQACGRQVNMVIYLCVPREVLFQRIAGRRICGAHQHVYNLYSHPPAVPGICDLDGSMLSQRADDNEDAVQRRLNIFFSQTPRLLDYYAKQGMVLEVNGSQAIEMVQADILVQLKRRYEQEAIYR